jgi:epoxide hydrolase-like predicted phosphatase
MTDSNLIPSVIFFDYGSVLEGPLDEAGFESDLAELATEFGFPTGRDLWNHLYVCDAWEQAKRGKISRDDYWLDRLNALGITQDIGQEEFKRRLHRNRGLRPEMDDLLRELRDHGYRLGVISNTSRIDLGIYLAQKRGLDGIFETVVSSAEVGIAKPDAAIYQIALDLFGIQPHEALFVDDLVRNTTAAESLGIPSIVFTTPAVLREELERREII